VVEDMVAVVAAKAQIALTLHLINLASTSVLISPKVMLKQY
jgi:hypothetical protein